jgi:hypothetical protein
MRIAIILILVSIIGLIIYFRKGVKELVEETSMPDLNPELVTYLQGDWSVTEDGQSILKIKKDSIIKIYHDTIRNVNSLTYIFNGAASKYFKNDSCFAFFSPGKQGVENDDFRLKEVNNNSGATTWDTLLYVSRSRLDMVSHGKIIRLNRVK